MRNLLGPRTIVEALFLIACPVVALAADLSWPRILIVAACGYAVVLVVELALARGNRPVDEVPRSSTSPQASSQDHVRVLAPEPPTAPAAEPEPITAEAEPEPDPAPVPVLTAVPDLPPDAEAEPAQEEEPTPEPAAPVVPIVAYGPPRQWNVWELEQLARERAGANPEKDEERTYLLMYLREFADADGLLPVDFDGLVRDSFGELVLA
jgi:hypothetical protein